MGLLNLSQKKYNIRMAPNLKTHKVFLQSMVAKQFISEESAVQLYKDCHEKLAGEILNH